MEGGRRRRVAWIAGLLLGLAVLAVVLAPLFLRGPVLRWAVGRGTRSLCGDFSLSGGRLGWAFVPQLLLGRSFAIEVDDARVLGPDGLAVIAAERVTGRVAIARHPWRITIDDAVVTHGSWRLAQGGGPGTEFVDAFRTVPEGGSRAACRERRPRKRDRWAASLPLGGSSLVVRDVRLDEVDANLDFRDWGLVLPRVRAQGSLAVGVPGTVLLFEARDVTSPGGKLRVGRVGSRGMTRAPFDDVAISHVAVTTDHPTDLELTVTHANTGQSTLSGKARFLNIFPAPWRRELRPPAGMALEAHWSNTAHVLRRLEAEWLPSDANLEDMGLGGAIVARLDGPFKELSGSITTSGPRTNLEVTLDHGRRAGADMRFHDLDLGQLLDARLRPLLAGQASGRLRARVALAPRVADMEASIDEAELSLARPPGTAGPRQLELRIGPRPRVARRAPLSTADVLSVGLDSARLHGGTLALEGFRARSAVLTASGRFELALPAKEAGQPAPARVDATLALTLGSLARWVAPKTFDAHGSANARVGGSFEHLRARLAFGPGTRVAILGEGFRVSPEVTATLDGRTLAVSEIRLDHEGGGNVTARVKAELPDNAGGHLEIRGYPLSRVPTFAQITPPKVLGAPAGASLAEILEGTLDASFDLRGKLPRPAASGTAKLTGVRVAGRRVDDGRFTVHLAPVRATLEGTLGPTLSVAAEGRARRDGVAASARVSMNGFALGPWLPPPIDQLVTSATGETRIVVEPHRDAHAAGAVRFTGPAGEVAFDGSVTRTTVDATARGRVEVGHLRPLWSPALANADGAVDLDLRLALDLEHPTPERIKGTIDVVRTLRAQPVGSPLVLDLAAGGRIAIEGPRVSTEGLTISTTGARAQVRGQVTFDLAAPARSRLALDANGQLEVGALAQKVGLPMLASAAGEATFDARAEGEARAPTLSGQVRFAAVKLRPTAPGWPPLLLDGTIEASGHTLRTRGLRVNTNPVGTLTVGAPATPASVELLSLDPPRLGHVDVPIAGRGLHFGDASTPLEIRALDVGLHLMGDARVLMVRGDVGVGHARFDPGKGKPSKGGPSRPWYESLPPHLTLDLTLHGAADAISVAVPGPDVKLGFNCHVSASARGATMSGRLQGSTVYSRMAIAVYDWFKSQDVRACRVLKEQ